jgi:ribulose-5-phosphate 4-epimerase/fuculose-1-phosphate aldolase
MNDYIDERMLVANACRVLAVRGMVDDILGHVSLRIDDRTVLVRVRGPRERGLRYTSVDDVQAVELEGHAELAEGYETPNELPLHLEMLRRNPRVRAVVHAHPPAVVAFSLTGRALAPIVGAFNIPAMRMARSGIPVHASSALIRTQERAAAMADDIGDSPVGILRGHGLTSVGDSVAQAVVRALNVDTLARMHLSILQAGAEPSVIDESDLVDLPDLGGAFNDGHVWRFLLQELAEKGLLLDAESGHG